MRVSKLTYTPLDAKPGATAGLPSGAGATLDALALIDPAKHASKGEWKKENGVLISPKGAAQFA